MGGILFWESLGSVNSIWIFEKVTTNPLHISSNRFGVQLFSIIFFKHLCMKEPLILTLAMNNEAEVFFNTLRQQHFPAERNYLAAHLTLFHHLPQKPKILENVAQLCARQPVLVLQVVDVVSIGRGVAYKLESAALKQLHKQLQEQWQPWLIPQDRQALWPHVTIQNKVAPEVAHSLLRELKNAFAPFEVQGVGLRLWNYLGGPWEFVRQFSFADVA